MTGNIIVSTCCRSPQTRGGGGGGGEEGGGVTAISPSQTCAYCMTGRAIYTGEYSVGV